MKLYFQFQTFTKKIRRAKTLLLSPFFLISSPAKPAELLSHFFFGNAFIIFFSLILVSRFYIISFFSFRRPGTRKLPLLRFFLRAVFALLSECHETQEPRIDRGDASTIKWSDIFRSRSLSLWLFRETPARRYSIFLNIPREQSGWLLLHIYNDTYTLATGTTIACMNKRDTDLLF